MTQLTTQDEARTLSESSDLLHAQLSQYMRAKIRSREWSAGERIPSEHSLMQTHQVSRGTVRHAIKTLVDEGLLVQMHGRGTFVSEQGMLHTSGSRLLSFAASLRQQGKSFVTRVLDQRVAPAPPEVAAQLAVPEGADMLFLRRVRTVGGEPVVCQESWLNLSVCPGLDNADFTRESAFDAVERCSGKHISYSDMRYSAVCAGRTLANYLGCDPAAAVLVLEQTISLEDHVPIEWSYAWLRDGQTVVGSSFQPIPTAAEPGTMPVPTGSPAGFKGEVPGIERRPATLSRAELERRALAIRRAVVEFAHNDTETPFHLGGSLSVADILAVLYGDIVRTGKDGSPWEERDRVVLSKAHAALALYPALLQAGFISQDDIDRGLFGPQAVLFKHPRRDIERGIESSGGSLGMGLGYACGLALAARNKELSSRVFCILGDGECNEGAVWEAAAFAGHNQLSQLTAIVDVNGMQLDGPTATVLDTGPLAAKFAAFGFEVVEVNGHDVMALRDALALQTMRPRAILAHTHKGRGLSFAENRVEWHDNILDDALYEHALADLAAAEEARA